MIASLAVIETLFVPIISCLQIQNSANQVSSTWKHQLMQLNNMSEPMASAVVAAYPSPAHLLSVSPLEMTRDVCFPWKYIMYIS